MLPRHNKSAHSWCTTVLLGETVVSSTEKKENELDLSCRLFFWYFTRLSLLFSPFFSSSQERSHSNKNLNTIVVVCLLIRMLIMDFRVLSLSHTRHWMHSREFHEFHSRWISKVNECSQKNKERYVGERRKNTWTKTDLIKLETKEDGWRTLKV